MKTSTYFFMVTIVAVTMLTSVQRSDRSSNHNLELQQAITSGAIVCKASGTCGYSGRSVKLTLKNNKQQTISIHVPVGTLFYPDDPGQQTLITVEQQIKTGSGRKKITGDLCLL